MDMNDFKIHVHVNLHVMTVRKDKRSRGTLIENNFLKMLETMTVSMFCVSFKYMY